MACATNNVHLSAQVAPRALPDDLGVRRIAVMDFQGPDGLQVSRELEADLVNHRFNGKRYFTVVDRDRTRQLMAEYARGLRGEINPETAARFGRQIGVQAILFGIVTADGIATSYHRGVATRCVAQDKIGICTKFATVSTTCVSRQARFAVTTRLVNTETAQVVYSKEHVGSAQSDSCNGKAPLDVELLASARTQALNQVVPDMAPSNVVLTVALKTDAATLSGAEKTRFLSAVAFARAGRMDRACQIWRSINHSGNPKDVAVLYDLAVCAETSGKLSEALELFQNADQLLARPDSNIDAALTRVRMEIAQRRRLRTVR